MSLKASVISFSCLSVNEEKPKLFHTEFVVDEGGTLVVDLPKLYAEDADVPEDNLVFKIVEAPINGRFLRMVKYFPALLRLLFIVELFATIGQLLDRFAGLLAIL